MSRPGQIEGVAKLLKGIFIDNELPDEEVILEGSAPFTRPPPRPKAPPGESARSAGAPSSGPLDVCVRCDGEREVAIRGVIAPCPLCTAPLQKRDPR